MSILHRDHAVLSVKRIIDLLVISLSSPCYRRDSPIIVTLAADVVCILIVKDGKQEEEEEPKKREEKRMSRGIKSCKNLQEPQHIRMIDKF